MVSIEKLISISKAAGDIILEFYQQQNYTQQSKSDHTPVTTADIKANEYIVNSLTTLYPDIPIIAEESELPCFEERKKWSDFFLVDPLDGTKEFIKRNGEFTVNIAYRSADGKSLGVVWAPVLDLLYFADGTQAFKEQAGVRELLNCGEINIPLKVTVSRSHVNSATQEFIDKVKSELAYEVEQVGVGSSLKFCYIADGSADLYPRLGPIKEWDIAAASLVLEQAGGKICHLEGLAEIKYNKADMLVAGFIALKQSLFSKLF